MAMWLLRLCRQIDCGLGWWNTSVMFFNILVDAVVGLIPVIGDVGDAFFRCNSKNVERLGKHLDDEYMPDELKERRDRGERWWMTLFGRRGTDNTTRIKKKAKKGKQDDLPYSPATVYEEFSDGESSDLPFTEPTRERRDPARGRREPARGRREPQHSKSRRK